MKVLVNPSRPNNLVSSLFEMSKELTFPYTKAPWNGVTATSLDWKAKEPGDLSPALIIWRVSRTWSAIGRVP